MSKRTSSQPIDQFVRTSEERAGLAGPFAAESERMLRVEVDGGVWLKPGAAVAYRGDLAFKRLPTIGHGPIVAALLREVTPLVRATGRGRLYCGHQGGLVRVLQLAGDGLVVCWRELLAFEDSLRFELAPVSHGIGLAAGGRMVVTLSGSGRIAIVTHGDPLTLRVTPGAPVFTDPHATLAWSASLTPSLKTDLSWPSLVAHGGHEPFQMHFEGSGFVVVQPYTDPNLFSAVLRSSSELRTLFGSL